MDMDQAKIDTLKRSFMKVANAISAKIDYNQYAAILSFAEYYVTDVEFDYLTNQLFRKSRKITWGQVLRSLERLQQRREAGNEIRERALAACRIYDTHGLGLITDVDLLTALWSVNIRIDCEIIDNAEKEELASSDPMLKYKDFIEEQLLAFEEYV